MPEGKREKEMPSHSTEERDRPVERREPMRGAGTGETPREAENRRRGT